MNTNEERAMTILNNCDNLLCLGVGRDISTAKYISYQANKPVSAILNTPLDSAWLLTRGSRAEQVAKFDLRQHCLYGRLPEAQAQKKDAGKEREPEVTA